ncbi:MAG: peptidoglycan-binding protein [Oscillospiraceae bacterium]|nr:peptidoglycan-binding protein [Oscillospiraceae bacterium]
MPTSNLPFVPERIIVHLGTPDSNAPNVSVTFPDYIKNVASSEIFPTWPEAALRANIYVQISFALNRVYTEWYRSRGYDFDITNSTQYDQAFVYGRDIFGNISQLVDEIFNNYIVRRGSVEPMFAMFCNGTTVTCRGLSQWGTVSLANQGYTPYEILQYYYGDDIDIVYNAPISENIPSYPGTPFGFGSSGNEVRTIQVELNRIRQNYPAIPRIVPANGIFGESTTQAVMIFQEVFGLPVTGIVNKSTWYQIKYIFTAVKGLSELGGEGLTTGEVTNYWDEDLRRGDYGQGVRALQYYLNVIAYFNSEIPSVPQTGVFGAETERQVKAFEEFYGLNPDGIVDFRTWQLISKIYNDILNGLPEGYEGAAAEIYPGYIITPGMRNNDVREMQTYLRVIGQNIGQIPVIDVTGYYGPETERAVTTFQRLYGLEPSGYVGSPTWDALAREYNYIMFGTERTG